MPRTMRFLTLVNLVLMAVFLGISGVLYSGCLSWSRKETVKEEATRPPDLGGNGLVLNLPIPIGDSTMCVQGAYGDWSHDGLSTLHDLDFDTSNFEDQEVFAPIAGIVRVHTESATSGFGYHVNIDLGDGTYVVIGHFKDIFVKDGEEVGEGQLLGYEGCTGSCTGDHIHIGLHEGDAGLTAEHGISIPVTYRADDLYDIAPPTEIYSDAFICGIKSQGDPIDGHVYGSTLPVPLWHPNGTLVKTPGNPMTYLLEAGASRWISTEDVFWSLNYDFADMALVSGEEFACYGDGAHIDELGLIDAAWDEAGDVLWLRVQMEQERYRQRVGEVAREQILESWGVSLSGLPHLAPGHAFFDVPIRNTSAVFRDGSILKEESRSDVYVTSDGWAMPVVDWNTYLMLGFGPREVLVVEDEAIKNVYSRIGDCGLDIACIDANAVTQCGGGLDLDDDFGGEGGNEDTGLTGHDDPPTDTDAEEIDTGTDSDADTDADADSDTDADVDTDSDADTDADSDTDSDSDSDSDSDTDTDNDTLTVSWATPFFWPAQVITLSGEYIFANGTYGFTWRELAEVVNDDDIVYVLPGVGSGDTFRFSVEYTDESGIISWSCIGPYPPGTRQGTAAADVDGTPITITEIGDPTGLTDGCGLFLTVP